MLTEREKQIVHGAALGLTNDQIGEKLWLAGSTVKSHFKRISRKTGIGDRSGLVSLGFKQGWLYWTDDELVLDTAVSQAV